MTWSFQLYSARNFQPWDQVLETLASIGFRNVEGFGGLYGDARALRARLDRHGLAMPTAHFSLDMLENDFAAAIEMARLLGVSLMVCPHITADLRPADAAGWRAFGERLGKVGERARWAGFDFAWHNHDFEFVALDDGSVPMTHILEAAPSIGWEIDVAWVIRGGADPAAWIAEHAGRIVAVHVKDIAPAGENADEDGWADVGHGSVGWDELVRLLKTRCPARYYIVEHDNPSDFARFARRSLATVERY